MRYTGDTTFGMLPPLQSRLRHAANPLRPNLPLRRAAALAAPTA